MTLLKFFIIFITASSPSLEGNDTYFFDNSCGWFEDIIQCFLLYTCYNLCCKEGSRLWLVVVGVVPQDEGLILLFDSGSTWVPFRSEGALPVIGCFCFLQKMSNNSCLTSPSFYPCQRSLISIMEKIALTAIKGKGYRSQFSGSGQPEVSFCTTVASKQRRWFSHFSTSSPGA